MHGKVYSRISSSLVDHFLVIVALSQDGPWPYLIIPALMPTCLSDLTKIQLIMERNGKQVLFYHMPFSVERTLQFQLS